MLSTKKTFLSHLKFIGLHADRPLPTDLGNMGLFEYSNALMETAGRDAFRKRLTGLLDTLQNRMMSAGLRHLRHSYVSLLKRCDELCKIYTKEYKLDHPFVRFISGWLEQLQQELAHEGPHVFQADFRVYETCLAFSSRTGKEGRLKPLPTLLIIQRRFGVGPLMDCERRRAKGSLLFLGTIFLSLDSSIIFVNSRGEAEHYRVFLKHSHGKPLDQHHFGEKGVGQHMLLMEPDLVGGYTEHSRQRYLRIQSDARLYRNTNFQYELVKRGSFQVTSTMTKDDIRREWMQTTRAGLWNSGWEQVELRTDDYFSNYDINIRILDTTL